MSNFGNLAELGGKVLCSTYDWYQKILSEGGKLFPLEEREIGDELVSERDGYTHHGIYIGNDEVIHFSGAENEIERLMFNQKGEIEIISLAKFCNERKTWVRRYKTPKYKGIDVVERAKSRLGNEKYRLLLNNCEHFTTWCILDVHFSKQVIDGNTITSTMLNLVKKYK